MYYCMAPSPDSSKISFYVIRAMRSVIIQAEDELQITRIISSQKSSY